ncbi:MAG: cobalamin-dependent protein [bacterium]
MTQRTKRKIVFLAANSSYSHTNLAALYLQAFTGDMGFGWTTVEMVATEDFHPALHRIVQLKPDVIAATFYLFNRKAVLSILHRYRLIDPKCRIIAGGPEFLGDNRHFFAVDRCVDGAIRGEGETAFRQLLTDIDHPDRWRNVPGFCGMVGGEYVDNGMATEITDLDDIPSPFALLTGEPHEMPLPHRRRGRTRLSVPTLKQATAATASDGLLWKGKPFLQLETSRGCRNSCAFCTSGASGTVRHFSIERVRTDLNLIRKTGVHNVRIVDRTFNENRSRCVELILMFRNEFADMDFHLEIDPSLIGPDVLQAMAGGEECGKWNVESGKSNTGLTESLQKAGRRVPTAPHVKTELSNLNRGEQRPARLHMDVGIQSFGESVLKESGRRGTAKSAALGLKALCGLGSVEVHADLIAGLPGATHGQTLKDLRQLVSLRPAEIQLELLKLLPGTRLSADRRKFGIIAASEPPYEVLKTRDMTAGDIHSARLLSKLVDWFYEPASLRETIWQANDTMPGFWKKLVEFAGARTQETNVEHRAFNIERPTGWAKPSLENRFRLMDEFLAETGENTKCVTPAGRHRHEQVTSDSLRQRLHYSWLKYGLSPNGGICEARPWKDEVPADAELIEGDAGAEICRMFIADIGRTYIFAYGRKDVDRKAVAVWRVGGEMPK